MSSLFLCITLIQSLAQIDPQFKDFIRQYQTHHAELKSFEASFVQFTQTDEVPTGLAAGVITFKAPASLLIQYNDMGDYRPSLCYVFDGNMLSVYNADTEQLDEWDSADIPEIPALVAAFSFDLSALIPRLTIETLAKSDFNDVLSRSFGTQNIGPIFRIKPVKPDDSLFASITVMMASNFLPRMILVEDALEKDQTVMIVVADVKLNPPSTGDDLRIRIPPGTTHVVNEEPKEDIGAGGLVLPRE